MRECERVEIDFQQDLNHEQCAAATAGDGPALILAAAGTGKTRTLVYRVAYLVSRGVSPERILLLTFTNRAAQEMLDRAMALLPGNLSGMPWSGTFHHVANRMLRRHAARIGFPPGFTILDQDDSRSLMSACIKEQGLKSKEFPKREVLLHVYSQAQNREMALVDAVEEHFGEHDVDIGQVLSVLRRYAARKRELESMDFDDLLVNCLALLRDHPDLQQQYAAQFQHVLVDEYQDTNKIQSHLVDLLTGPDGNLFVVGDDFQSIYAWRGADTRHILSFPERYPSARIYKLETNYRSVPEVLDLANVTVACSGQSELFRKVLRPTRPPYHRPVVARLRDGEVQARYVVEAIRSFRRDGYQPEDIVILYRAHYHAMELQMELTRNRIPHHVTSGIRFFEQAHVKDALCLLRVLSSTEDILAFQRLLALLPGVGEVTAMRVWKKLGGHFDASDAGQREVLLRALPKGGQERWRALEPVLNAYYTDGLETDGGSAVGLFVQHFYDKYAYDTYENAESRLDDLAELQVQFERFESVSHCLQDVALLTNLDAEEEPLAHGGKVRLSTVHQAKGLEWPVVIVLWLTEGMFPSSRSLSESAEGEAEERRLFYVAATRAKDELVLCVPEYRRMRDGGGMFCLASRFIEELPKEAAQVKRISNMI
jgi:DNA helicase II / ATP-dependent DNA helicase PcrA